MHMLVHTKYFKFFKSKEEVNKNQGIGREVVAHLVPARKLVANLTKWLLSHKFLPHSHVFSSGKWVYMLFLNSLICLFLKAMFSAHSVLGLSFQASDMTKLLKI
jgi:hypothetical protein